MKNVFLLSLILLLTSSFIRSDRVIEVDVLSNETVTINSSYVEKEDICDSVYVLLFNHNYLGRLYPRTERELQRVIVSIYSDRSVKYNQFIFVYNEIEKAYSHAWNSLALSKYSSEYQDLTELKKHEIRKMLPKIISEADLKK